MIGETMALTDIAIRNAKPGAKAIKMADAGGMFLLVTPAGGKLWRLKYRIDGREKLLAIGAYPEISLSEARKRREEARELIALGKDPSREKQRERSIPAFRPRTPSPPLPTNIAPSASGMARRDGHRPRPVAANIC